MERIRGFPAISMPDARILILGSMPSVRSLQVNEYYAHKANAFWRIMGDLMDAGWDKTYSERIRILNEKGIAVWDVVESCVRPGSRDLDIRHEEPNDFPAFFEAHPHIKRIGLNGQKAAECFNQFVKVSCPPQISLVTLPSTSRANAWWTFDEKRDAWRAFLLD